MIIMSDDLTFEKALRNYSGIITYLCNHDDHNHLMFCQYPSKFKGCTSWYKYDLCNDCIITQLANLNNILNFRIFINGEDKSFKYSFPQKPIEDTQILKFYTQNDETITTFVLREKDFSKNNTLFEQLSKWYYKQKIKKIARVIDKLDNKSFYFWNIKFVTIDEFDNTDNKYLQLKNFDLFK